MVVRVFKLSLINAGLSSAERVMTDLSKGAAFINDQYVPVAEACIPVLDWGFLHSDATYDVAHVWQGRSRTFGRAAFSASMITSIVFSAV
jgi:hypothetical protein